MIIANAITGMHPLFLFSFRDRNVKSSMENINDNERVRYAIGSLRYRDSSLLANGLELRFFGKTILLSRFFSK